MAARQDILNLEADRKESVSWNIIHMFKEGSFWHAYEWSAWLICVITYNNEKHKRDNTGDPIAVVHKPIGGKNQQGTYTMVGFQIKSLDKFVPQRILQPAQADIPEQQSGSCRRVRRRFSEE